MYVGQKFFSGNWVVALWLGPPRPNNPPPPPPTGLRGPFFNFGAAQPCFTTIFVFYFFPMFFGIFAKVYPSIFMIRPKKNFGGLFLEFFHFLFSKVESARTDGSGQKTKMPHLIFHIQYKNLKKIIVFLFLPFIE